MKSNQPCILVLKYFSAFVQKGVMTKPAVPLQGFNHVSETLD